MTAAPLGYLLNEGPTYHNCRCTSDLARQSFDVEATDGGGAFNERRLDPTRGWVRAVVASPLIPLLPDCLLPPPADAAAATAAAAAAAAAATTNTDAASAAVGQSHSSAGPRRPD
jgi:hypothetical protein